MENTKITLANLPLSGGSMSTHDRFAVISLLVAWCSLNGPAHAQTCINVNDCSGGGYAVKTDFTMSDPVSQPTNTAGPGTGGFCSASDTYRTYVAWCNESGCTAVSPASSDFQPASGTSNKITVTRSTIPGNATSWAAYYSKASQGHATLRHCTQLTGSPGAAAAASTSFDCSCMPVGALLIAGNGTDVAQTNRLHPDGSERFSQRDGSVQGKLVAEKNVLEFSADLVPRFSPNSGNNYRTVDWNSAKVLYVDSTLGGGTSPGGRTVFNTLDAALSAVGDSSYTNPWVIRLRSNDGTPLADSTVSKPYVWIQGDGSTRTGRIVVKADGVRVSGLIARSIMVGNPLYYGTPVDVDNVWIFDNIITNDPNVGFCEISVSVGGGSRSHGVMVSNNRLGGSGEPGSSSNKCRLVTLAGNGGTQTVVQFVGNYVENSDCIHGDQPLGVKSLVSEDAGNTTTISSGNTFFCNIKAGIVEQGENFSCVDLEMSFGHLHSIGDSCIMYRPDSGTYHHNYTIVQTDQTYTLSYPRSASFENTLFSVNLPAAHHTNDKLGFAYIDGAYLSLRISNPRYREIALGSGWSSADKYFIDVDAWRNPPPSSANTFFTWEGVTEAPDSDIIYTSGATAANITAGPAKRLVPDAFDAGLLLTGATLGGTCTLNELRFDTGGATKELCLCSPANTWNCAPLGAKQD